MIFVVLIPKTKHTRNLYNGSLKKASAQIQKFDTFQMVSDFFKSKCKNNDLYQYNSWLVTLLVWLVLPERVKGWDVEKLLEDPTVKQNVLTSRL